MAKATRTNDPFVNDWKERLIHAWRWIKKNFMNIIQVGGSVATVLIAYYSLQSSNRAVNVALAANASSDSLSQVTTKLSEKLTNATDTSAKALQKAADAFDKYAQVAEENLKYSELNTQAQVALSEETRSQFERINNPFLQVEASLLNYDSVDHWPRRIAYRFKNYGRFSVQIIGQSSTSIIRKKRKATMEEFSNLISAPDSTELVISTESPEYENGLEYYDSIYGPSVVTMMLTDNYKSLFFGGYCDYINLINDEICRYEFIYRVRKNSIILIYSENYRTKRRLKKK